MTTMPRPVTRRRLGAWAGFGTWFLFTLRRDRFRLPAWIIGIAAMEAFVAASLVSLYPDEQSRAGMALTLDNAGSTAMIGRIYHAHDYHWGIMVGHETLVLVALAAALMGVLTVVRHTRAEEETGRAELALASPLGRYTALTSAVLVAVWANVVLALVLAGSLVALGEPAIDAAGALTFGAAAATVGLVFTGVAAVAAQLAGSARVASSTAALLLAAAFLVRALGDVADNWLGWLSPIGWAQRTFPWDANDAAPLALGLGVFVALMVLAGWLSGRRDVGEAFWAARTGRTGASALFGSPLALAVRLNRSAIAGWSLAMFVFGAVYGPVLADAETFLEQMPVLGDFLPGAADAGGVKLFAGIVVALAAIVAAVPAAQVVTRMCADERAGRTGWLLATLGSRLRWFGSVVVVALAGAALVLGSFGLGFGLGAGWATEDWALVGDIVVASLGYVPAVAVIVGVAALLAGWVPRLIGMVWLLVGHAVVILYFAELLDWPEALAQPSAFHHVATRPAVTGDPAESLWLSAIAVALLAVGALGYRQRPVA